jgi:hypothetical protein
MSVNMNLYELKEVGKDFIVIEDSKTDVKITFADREDPSNDLKPKKEEEAAFFYGIKNKLIGLEVPVGPFKTKKNMNIFMDTFVDMFGTVKSIPFPFTVASIEITEK